jgi:membrane protease subunit HflK
MAWNEPGGGGRDPWGKRDNDGPPDLDEFFKKIKESLEKLFGGKKSGGNGRSSGGDSGFPVYLILGLLGAAWLFSSFYVLDEGERGVVMRFGKYHTTIMPGLSFNPYLIDTVEVVRVTEERQYTASGDNSMMLTRDENIVLIPLTVQYNISDVRNFVINVNNPVQTLEEATDSAIRHVVGSTPMEAALSDGRLQMSDEVHQRLQTYLDSYGTGINVIDVTLQRGEPPEQVKDAFDDVNSAEQDRDRLIDQAQAYRNGILPAARGEAQRIIEAAEAYKGELIARAEGEAARFNQLYAEYSRAPEVTRERLYLDAVNQVMNSSSKVMVDVQGGNNLMYLPLDQLRRQSGSATNSSGSSVDRQQLIDDVLREIQRNGSSSNNNQRLR